MTRVSGSVQSRNGIYHMIVRYTDSFGNSFQKSKTTKIPEGCTKRERATARRHAEAMLEGWIKELEIQLESDRNRTVLTAINEWMMQKKDGVRPNTYLGYVSYVENHIKPFFEKKDPLLKDVTVRDIQRFIDNEHKAGRKAQSIKKYLVVLHGVFDDAVRYGEILANPCDKAKLPKATTFRGQALSKDQVAILLNGVRNDPIEPVVMLGVFLGLRRSEISGLRWSDIDLQNGIAHIQNTIVKYSNGTMEDEHTKSRASRRDLVLPTTLRVYLAELRATQSDNKERLGIKSNGAEHVCEWTDGTPLNYNYITRHFKVILKRLGLPNIRLHDLRHTAGSLLINNGVDAKRVQEFLGHEDISTTLNTYTHLDMAAKYDTAATIDALIGG